MDTAIDWALLAEALSYYQAQGYERVEADWFVPLNVQMLTCPDVRNVMQVKGHGCLVGSAEQSFLGMTLGGLEKDKRYVALTPCFRNENVDASHAKSFMKVELFYASKVSPETVAREMLMMKLNAYQFMNMHARKDVMSVATEHGFDLELNRVEVGSYGVREIPDFFWAYGTGLAEPRFSYANETIQHQKR